MPKPPVSILGGHGEQRLTDRFFQVCWLLVSSVGLNEPVRTPHAVSCPLPISERKSTISSMHLIIFSKGERRLCRGFSPSSRA
jgi:hypothetical protein